jgi:formamidopyrimidine-DNA glycosylase
MPELPEVETVVRTLRPALVGRVIQSAWLDWERSLVPMDVPFFLERIRGQRILGVERRAKYIVMPLSQDHLLIHLKMTGRLYVVSDSATHAADRWVHFRFQLEGGEQLRFSDSRKFGRVYLTADPASILGALGPEPLASDFTVTVFADRLKKRAGRIKPLLLNQTFLAGVGNIYADEALHLAKIHPRRGSATLTEGEIAALYGAIRQVLAQGIQAQGASVRWYRTPEGEKGQMQEALLVYDRAGQPCLTCQQGIIQKITLGQRGTHFCPHCQKED